MRRNLSPNLMREGQQPVPKERKPLQKNPLPKKPAEKKAEKKEPADNGQISFMEQLSLESMLAPEKKAG